MVDRELVCRLQRDLEELGCTPEVCERCGAFQNWPKTATEDPLSKAQDEGAVASDLFCHCD